MCHSYKYLKKVVLFHINNEKICGTRPFYRFGWIACNGHKNANSLSFWKNKPNQWSSSKTRLFKLVFDVCVPGILPKRHSKVQCASFEKHLFYIPNKICNFVAPVYKLFNPSYVQISDYWLSLSVKVYIVKKYVCISDGQL